MVCQWFYSNTSKQSSGCASDAIVKSLFRDNLPGLNDLTDEQMYDTITRYLGPNRRTYVNGEFITPEVMQKIQNEQIRLFHKKYKGIKSSALADLLKVRANAQVGDSKINEVEIEATTARFLQQTREALTQLLKMLCITEEKYNVTLDLPRKQPTGSQVLAIVQRQVEHIVGHTIEIPEEFRSIDKDEDLESYVASVTGGPEEFFASILLEDLKNAMQKSQENGTRSRSLKKN